MKEILRTYYNIIFFIPEEKLLRIEALKKEELPSDKNFVEFMKVYASIIEKYGVEKVLFDIRNSIYMIRPQLQEWTQEHILPRTAKAGLKKVAILANSHIITQLSVEQTVFEQDIKQVKIFHREDEAMQFLRN